MVRDGHDFYDLLKFKERVQRARDGAKGVLVRDAVRRVAGVFICVDFSPSDSCRRGKCGDVTTHTRSGAAHDEWLRTRKYLTTI